jgi:hypothetical protein
MSIFSKTASTDIVKIVILYIEAMYTIHKVVILVPYCLHKHDVKLCMQFLNTK